MCSSSSIQQTTSQTSTSNSTLHSYFDGKVEPKHPSPCEQYCSVSFALSLMTKCLGTKKSN